MIKEIIFRFKSDRKIILKLIRTFFSRGLAAVGTLTFHFILARVMGMSEYGLFVIGYVLITGASLFAKFGMTSAIIKSASIMFKNREFGKILKLKREVTFLVLLLSIIISMIFAFSTDLISDLLFDGLNVRNLILVFSLSLPFFSVLTIQSSFLKSFSRPEIAPFYEIGLMVFFTALFTFFYSLFTENVTSFDTSIIFLVSCFVVFLTGNYTLRSIIDKETGGKKYPLEKFKGFYSTLISFGITNICSYFLKFSPILILGYYFSSREVGYYSISNNAAFLINFVLWVVDSVYSPFFANLYREDKIDELKALLKKATTYMLIIAIPVFLVIITFSNTILSLFEPNFNGSTTPLLILAFAQLINVATGPVLFLMNMIGRERELMIINLITSTLTVFLGLILVPKYNYLGAAIATALGLIVQNLTAFFLSKRIINNTITINGNL